VQVDSIYPPFPQLYATHLLSLDRANDVSSNSTVVQVDSIRTRVVESACGVCNQSLKNYNIMNPY